MSRLADALRRAEGQDPSAEMLRQAQQGAGQALWGIDRTEPAVREPATIATATPAPAVEPAPLRERNEAVEQHLTMLVERVFLPIAGEPSRLVAFASTGGEVRSGPFTATAATLLAERTTGSICVIDANLRMPSVHEQFGVSNTSGLVEALSSETPLLDSARRLQRNLWVVPAGTGTTRSGLDSAAARQRMAQFVEQFDYVLVDVEPIGAGSNVAGLLRLVDGVIIVVSADSTRREVARRATQALAESGVTVIGAVLTNQQSAVPNALYRLL